ncbi:hypothetical protein G9A89_023327 [Geosiphon pyriformis]|nr:hypothetical protein G9A89_023327 [Geosiphon pyriformis]
MSLTRNIFPNIAQELSRAFSLLDEPLFQAGRRLTPAFPSLTAPTRIFTPSVDVAETDKNYLIEAEVPGMKKDDLSVEFLDDNTLILKGKIERGTDAGQPEQEQLRTVDATQSLEQSEDSSTDIQTLGSQRPTYWSSERVIGSFSRAFQFPGRIEPQKVKASYKDGILSVVVPKVETHGTRIPIE